MDNLIENKIANAGLINLDLADYYPKGKRAQINMQDFLFQGLILKEKEFREKVKTTDWSQYQDYYVNITLLDEAIVPNWAYMLVASQLYPFAKRVVFGTQETLETLVFIESLKSGINPEDYQDKRVLVKGCGDIEISPSIYIEITNLLQPIVKSLMFGEACSSVPVYKKKL